MHAVKKTSENLLWCEDTSIIAGIAVCLLVINNATSLFSSFTGQFSYAALLFYLGYTAKLQDFSFYNLAYTQAKKILIPCFAAFTIFLFFSSILFYTQKYSLLFREDMLYPGIIAILKAFLFYGDNYLYLLKDLWLLPTIFGTYLLAKVCRLFCSNKYVYLFVSCMLLIVGMGFHFIILRTSIFFFHVDLILVAHFYFAFGLFWKQSAVARNETLVNRQYLPIGFGCFIVMLYIGQTGFQGVDFPARGFNFFLLDIAAGINGSILTFMVMLILSSSKIVHLQKALAYIGKNWLGVVLLHVSMFKIGGILLWWSGAVSISYLQNLTPPNGDPYWPLLAIVSIAGSLAVWQILQNIVSFIRTRSIKFSIILTLKTLVKKCFLRGRNLFHYIYIKVSVCVTPLNLSVFGIVLLSLIPLYNLGPIVNDELQYRFARKSGIINLLQWYWNQRKLEGRQIIPLSVFNTVVDFLFSSDAANSLVRIFFLLIGILLLGYFMGRITRNKHFGAMVAVLAAMFLPITFEHSAPMAFSGLVVLPVIYLLFSFILFIRSVETSRKDYYIGAMVFFALALLSYEFMVTFVLIFPLLAYIHFKTNRIQATIRYAIIPIIMGFLYTCIYLGMQFLSTKAGYSGAQVGVSSLAGSIEILVNLMLSALPGFYLFNEKYMHLSNMYMASIRFVDVLRIMMLFYIVIISRKRILDEKEQHSPRKPFAVLAMVAMLYMFIPSLPNSISAGYQGIVGPDKNFIALPVTLLLYLSGIVAASSILWIIFATIKWKSRMTVLLVIALLALPVQWQSNRFANAHLATHERLLKIEALFDTNRVKSMKDIQIFAPEFYSIRNSLGIHGRYWTRFASEVKDIPIDVVGIEDVDAFHVEIWFPNNEFFVMLENESTWVLSDVPRNGTELVLSPSGEKYTILYPDTESAEKDGIFYYYSVHIDESQ